MQKPEYTDDQLYCLLKTGSEEAFKLIFEFYRKRLIAEALYVLKDEADALDIVQETFVTLWERKDTLIIKISLQSYLLAIVRNSSLKVLASRTRRQKLSLNYAIFRSTTIQSELPKIVKDEYENSEKFVIEQVVQSIESIRNPNRRLAFFKRYFQAKSLDEISDEMGYPKQTVQNWLTQAIKHVRQSINKKSVSNRV